MQSSIPLKQAKINSKLAPRYVQLSFSLSTSQNLRRFSSAVECSYAQDAVEHAKGDPSNDLFYSFWEYNSRTKTIRDIEAGYLIRYTYMSYKQNLQVPVSINTSYALDSKDFWYLYYINCSFKLMFLVSVYKGLTTF